MTTETTVNTIEQPGEFDALVKLRPGEPYFALLGRDKLAPELVLEWARHHRANTLNAHDRGEVNDSEHAIELRQATQAEEIAWAMKGYRRNAPTPTPTPAQPATPAPSYTGHELPAESERRNRELAVRAKCSDRLHNLIAELYDHADQMQEFDEPTAAAMRNVANAARNVADRARPARPALERAHG